MFKEFSPSTNMYIKKNVLKGMASTFSIKGNHTEDIKWYWFYCAIADSEENLNSLSDSTSMTSTPQSEGKTPLSPRDFWREKDGSFMFVLFSLSKSHAVGHSAMGATWMRNDSYLCERRSSEDVDGIQYFWLLKKSPWAGRTCICWHFFLFFFCWSRFCASYLSVVT